MKTLLAFLLVALCLGCGYGTKSTTPPSPGTKPTIAALVPNNVNANSAPFVLTINGTSFNGDARVKWNGALQTTTFVTSNQLTINVPTAMVATPGTVQVTVINPATPGGIYGGGTLEETSSPTTFTIN